MSEEQPTIVPSVDTAPLADALDDVSDAVAKSPATVTSTDRLAERAARLALIAAAARENGGRAMTAAKARTAQTAFNARRRAAQQLADATARSGTRQDESTAPTATDRKPSRVRLVVVILALVAAIAVFLGRRQRSQPEVEPAAVVSLPPDSIDVSTQDGAATFSASDGRTQPPHG